MLVYDLLLRYNNNVMEVSNMSKHTHPTPVQEQAARLEAVDYQNNLTDILTYTGGRHLLSVAEVGRFTGLSDRRTVKRRFPFADNRISAATLARCLSAPERP